MRGLYSASRYVGDKNKKITCLFIKRLNRAILYAM